jgi:hypothetical protein
LAMANWQTTAKTIFCEAVNDEVTVMVYKDHSVQCTGFKKYTQPNDITRQTVKDKQRLKISVRCEGEKCPRVVAYQKTIFAEEVG